jgi:ATP-binding cassette subfamily B (MDR/TAP) protein 1
MLAKILTFEIGWFDRGDNTSGAICSRLSKDANIVKVQAQTNTIYMYMY